MINRIACFGVGGRATRVYWLGTHVMETGFGSDGQWYTADLNKDDPRLAPAYNSSIACWAVHGQISRVYYFDGDLRLMELGFYPEVNGWEISSLTQDQNAPYGASGGGITCFGLNNDVARVYYFDSNDSLIELADVGANEPWHVNNLSAITHAPATGSARVLTCFGVNGVASRVYYFDQHGNVIELAWADDKRWHAYNISAAARAPAASFVSPIACFGVSGWATRVYYFDASGHVIELGWSNNNEWYAGDISAACGAPPAFTPSGLTCFGVGRHASRIYYFDNYMNLIELGWGDNRRWYWGAITIAPKANGPLTCFGVDGQLTRVYFRAGSPTRLYEVAFINSGWNASIIS
jgi:hypothetical protein